MASSLMMSQASSDCSLFPVAEGEEPLLETTSHAEGLESDMPPTEIASLAEGDTPPSQNKSALDERDAESNKSAQELSELLDNTEMSMSPAMVRTRA